MNNQKGKRVMKNCKKMLALVCTLALTLSMALGVVTVQAEGESTVTTADELKAAIANGGSVVLGNDITASIEIPENVSVTLNLNGCTLSDDGAADTISNRGTLTITGSGTVQNSNGKGALVNYPGAAASLNGGIFTANRWYTIKNMGSMTISEETKVTTTSGGASSLIANGWYNASNPGGNDRNTSYTGTLAVLNITGGEFDGGMNTVKNDDASKLTISGGTFTNTKDMIILNWNIAEISGGTFNQNSGAVLANGYLAGGLDQGEFTITGGTFTSGANATAPLFAYGEGSAQGGTLSITGGEFAGKVSGDACYTVAITGGGFSQNPASKVAEDGTVVKLTSEGNEKFYVGKKTFRRHWKIW